MKQKRFFLREDQIPGQWYNIQADMPVKPMPMLNPATRQPVKEDDHEEKSFFNTDDIVDGRYFCVFLALRR